MEEDGYYGYGIVIVPSNPDEVTEDISIDQSMIK